MLTGYEILERAVCSGANDVVQLHCIKKLAIDTTSLKGANQTLLTQMILWSRNPIHQMVTVSDLAT